jgi:alanine dehydrogenase
VAQPPETDVDTALFRFIPADEVMGRATPRAAMAAIEDAFAAHARGELTGSTSLGLTVPDGTFHAKACASLGGAFGRLFVAKVNANFPANPVAHGLPTIQGVIAVFDASDGRLLALVDSPSVTNLRTAATSAVAIKRLARADARVAAIIGCGVQGRAHADVLGGCMTLDRVMLHDLDTARARQLAARIGAKAHVATSLREATLASDVIVTCTPSLVPILHAGDLKPGTLVVGVGADNERKSEIDASVLAVARIVADDVAQARKTGDAKQLHEEPIEGDMADVVAGRVRRTGDEDLVVFDSSGLALEDLALCALLVSPDYRYSRIGDQR